MKQLFRALILLLFLLLGIQPVIAGKREREEFAESEELRPYILEKKFYKRRNSALIGHINKRLQARYNQPLTHDDLYCIAMLFALGISYN